MYKRTTRPRVWAFAAAVVMMIIFLIPHSLLGSELDYNKLNKQQVERQSITTEQL
jgi:energy-converting hydrogenase Eha subunit F